VASAERTSFWDAVARDYDKMYATAWSRREDADVRALLQPLWTQAFDTAASPVHVDLGAGTGLAQRLLESHRYIAVDISEAMLRRVQAGSRVQGSFDVDLPLRSESCDLVTVLFAAASYAKDLRHLATETFRILRPGRWLYLSTLGRYSLRRLLRFRTTRIERFGTRNGPIDVDLPLATCYSHREVQRVLTEIGFRNVCTVGLNCLAGVAEVPTLYRPSRAMARWVPNTSHLLEAIAQR
jgi:SAM-dependent methyltransferase